MSEKTFSKPPYSWNSYEEMMEGLEKISSELENGDLTLNEAMTKFEEGMKLSKKCSEILDSAEKKIKILINDTEEDFSVE